MRRVRLLLWSAFAVLIAVGVTSCEGSYRTRVIVSTLNLSVGTVGTVRISILNPSDVQTLQVGPLGFFTFDPSVIQVTGVTGVNGFTIFGSTVNNLMGWVQFAAGFPGGSIRPIAAPGLSVLEIPIVEITVQGVGPIGSQTDLIITAIDLFTDRVGQPIPTGNAQSGKVVIVAP